MDLSHLRDFRQKAVLSQEQLAEKSGVARDTISKLETGHRQAYPTTVRKLAAGLDIEPQMLVGGVRYLDDGGAKGDTTSDEAKKSSEEGPKKKMGF
jgi:transcriptional regulator with XRE-family HTH domain